MKKYTLQCGLKHPTYERINGGIRIFYHQKKVKKVIEHKNPKTGITEIMEYESCLCDVVEYDKTEATEILRLLKEGKDSVECQRWLLKAKIEAYDASVHVNEFTIGGVSVWLDKATRAGLLLRFQSERAMGKTNTTLWYNGMKFDLLIDAAIQILYALEAYASACYDVTQQHLSTASEMVEGFLMYDYASGYPQKLAF